MAFDAFDMRLTSDSNFSVAINSRGLESNKRLFKASKEGLSEGSACQHCFKRSYKASEQEAG